ncbi:phosphoenolpyruvate synthase [Candidatus Woesearchaeota archaeon]|nr:phosphoenolpyruvate synthase [Candidatus Woesearchaeota archaeon]
MVRDKKFILWFNELGIEDVPIVGGKNASLGEMYRNLTKKGVKVPNGFAVTAHAYNYFLEKAGIKNEIKKILKSLNKNKKNLSEIGKQARDIILRSELPLELKEETVKSYKKLCKQYGANADVAVRSSATAEDLPDASFAGQQETYLNIRGEHALIEATKKCFASLFTNRAISYRVDKGFGHFRVSLSVGVQKMVRSDKACSGVMFSIDTETGFKDAVLINGAYGLGENIVQGSVNPDQFYVFKPTLNKGYRPIISKKLGSKKIMMVYSEQGTKHTTENIEVPYEKRFKFVLNDDEILKLSEWACIIEDYYSGKAKKFKPMDMEWAKDGMTNELFIVQARPETVQSQRNVNVLEEYILKEKGPVVVTGLSVGMKISNGKAHVIKSVKGIKSFKKGEVLITEKTDPDWEPILKIAGGVVTDKGGRTCFFGSTKLLTNRGFLTIKQIHSEFSDKNDLYTTSLDVNTNKIIWRRIIASEMRKSNVCKFQVSPTLRSKQNFIISTPDHKFFTLNDRKVIKKHIRDIIKSEEGVLVSEKIPQWGNTVITEKKSYLLGALLSDGSWIRNKQGGYVVSFTQEMIPDKTYFIDTLCSNFKEVYGAILKKVSDKRSNVVNFQCYSKNIYTQLVDSEKQLQDLVLSMDEPLLLRYLAGFIDGDGNISHHQLQITVGEINRGLLEAIVIASYRIGIIPTIIKRKSRYVVSYSENAEKLLKFTKRVKGEISRYTSGKRFLSRQVLSDVIKNIDEGDRIKYSYIRRNRSISASAILKKILPKLEDASSFENILNSDFSMQRIKLESDLGVQEVYDITVEASEEMNHNYLVFTDNYTPLIASNCHAAIVTRELGIPAIVGTEHGTEIVKTGTDVTVSCAEGEVGKVYKGKLKFEIKKVDLKKLKRPKTMIMMNVGNPDQAFEFSFIPNDGVGLAREEFIISSYIKVHPLALLHYSKLKDRKTKDIIDELTYAYKNKVDFFVEKLAEGVAMIGAAFYPKDVIVRMSDFKTNEYANLIGGSEFEPKEENPMLGWRGASRYYAGSYREAFGLECMAMKKAREEMGLNNIKLMIPFCRTVDEGKQVVAEMKKYGLIRGKNGLEIYVMAEIPSNVILADDFAKIFDGFSIGSNDLTQLTLGLDRDSELVSRLYDERNPAVKNLIDELIKKAKKNKRKVGICGQGPSDHIDFAQFLVKCGIDSISLNPDTVLKTTLAISEMEKKLKK